MTVPAPAAANAPAAVPDFDALRGCWHPVAYAHELGAEPAARAAARRGARALARLARARRTRCATSASTAARRSRSAASSATGSCARTTAGSTARRHLHGDPAARRPDARPGQGARRRVPLPGALRAAVGRDGRAALARCPTIPELDDAAGRRHGRPVSRGTADASRQLENFTDFGHFPWVHPGLLGDPERPVVPAHTRADRRPRAALRRRPARGAQHRRLPGLRQRAGARRPSGAAATSSPAVHDPAAARLGRRGGHGLLLRLPARRRRPLHRLRGRSPATTTTTSPTAVLQDFEDTIFDQDRRVVESQRPERVPFDLAAEMHLKFDAVAVDYRKAMRAQGLAASHAA